VEWLKHKALSSNHSTTQKIKSSKPAWAMRGDPVSKTKQNKTNFMK
jgi:hypothetical protein